MSAIDDPKKDAAILRAVAYHRRDFDLSVIRSRSEDHTPILTSISRPFLTSPVSNLGGLERLPLELTSAICLQLDILSCFRLRQVNRLARHVVSGVREYKLVTNHGLDALHAMLRTGTAGCWTLPKLYRPLITMECSVCGGFGGFMFLPTAARCCFSCIKSAPTLRTASLASLSKRSGIPARQLSHSVCVVTTIPGRYHLEQKKLRRRTKLVGAEGALQTMVSLGLWPEGAGVAPELGKDTPEARCMVSAVLPYFDRGAGKAEQGVSCKGCEGATKSSYEQEVYRRRDRVFSKQGLLDHFSTCPDAQKLWDASCGGSITVEESEFTRRGGFVREADL